jgi:drug/metabolite transporter (DMT)-like permease
MNLNNGFVRTVPVGLGKQLGYVAVIIYCLCISIASVWVNTSFSGVDGATLTFITIFVAQLIFVFFSAVNRQNLIGLILDNSKSVIYLNILTVTSWFFMFMALQKIEASVEAAIYQGWVPVSVLLCGLFISRAKLSKKRAVSVLLIFLSIVLLVYARITYQTVSAVEQSDVYSGIILATIAGITAGVYIFYSSTMHERGSIPTLSILSVRFVLLLVITGYMSFSEVVYLIQHNPTQLVDMIYLSLFIVVIPIYCLQSAISTLGGVRVSIIIPAVPAIALAVEYFVAPWGGVVVPSLIIVLCTCVIYSNHILNSSVVKK